MSHLSWQQSKFANVKITIAKKQKSKSNKIFKFTPVGKDETNTQFRKLYDDNVTRENKFWNGETSKNSICTIDYSRNFFNASRKDRGK